MEKLIAQNLKEFNSLCLEKEKELGIADDALMCQGYNSVTWNNILQIEVYWGDNDNE